MARPEATTEFAKPKLSTSFGSDEVNIYATCYKRGGFSYTIADSAGDQSADAPAGIVQPQRESSPFDGRGFCDQRRRTDLRQSQTEANNEAARNEHADVLRGALDHSSNQCDDCRINDGLFPSSPVDNGSSEQRHQTATDIADCRVERLGRCGEGEIVDVGRHDIEGPH